MDNEVLKSYVIGSLNEIKELALSLGDGGLSQDDIMDITDYIIEECDLTIGELNKGE